jgi:hypothetical protein
VAIRGRWSIDSSPDDRALRVSRFLFPGLGRVGRLSLAELTADCTNPFAKWGKLDGIVYQAKRTDHYGDA